MEAADVRARELRAHTWFIAATVVAAGRVSDGRAYHTHSPVDRQTPMYIDPAAGSLILQVLIAGVLAVATTFKSARQSVARALRNVFGSRKEK
jgi:hypothetical protein